MGVPISSATVRFRHVVRQCVVNATRRVGARATAVVAGPLLDTSEGHGASAGATEERGARRGPRGGADADVCRDAAGGEEAAQSGGAGGMARD